MTFDSFVLSAFLHFQFALEGNVLNKGFSDTCAIQEVAIDGLVALSRPQIQLGRRLDEVIGATRPKKLARFHLIDSIRAQLAQTNRRGSCPEIRLIAGQSLDRLTSNAEDTRISTPEELATAIKKSTFESLPASP